MRCLPPRAFRHRSPHSHRHPFRLHTQQYHRTQESPTPLSLKTLSDLSSMAIRESSVGIVWRRVIGGEGGGRGRAPIACGEDCRLLRRGCEVKWERDPVSQITHYTIQKETPLPPTIHLYSYLPTQGQRGINLCVGGLPKPPERRGPFPVSATRTLGRRWKTIPREVSCRRKVEKNDIFQTYPNTRNRHHVTPTTTCQQEKPKSKPHPFPNHTWMDGQLSSLEDGTLPRSGDLQVEKDVRVPHSSQNFLLKYDILLDGRS
ncbi:hypothetical protein JTE90_027431 [Oedothorax gibbosus]|uniref:Uncharacterized protein n=1 Tax=Oedothorax gibbosus TaxID=931172 RepID=A0AAV6W544_9ARAC|nr:hypothetical protein JTE90_027431 [Oedothorax gibbosus]